MATAEYAINSSRSASTGKSAFEVVLGRTPNLPIDESVAAFVDCKVESSRQYLTRMREVVSAV